jgi:AraC-like DNA-binding protein
MNQDEALSMNDSYLQNLKKIVINNLENEHFSVEELADKAGISRSQLHRKLKQLVGLSVSEFIRNIRLEEAVHKLKNNTGTISEIAYQTGFSSPGYFNKVFQKQFKVSRGNSRKILPLSMLRCKHS